MVIWHLAEFRGSTPMTLGLSSGRLGTHIVSDYPRPLGLWGVGGISHCWDLNIRRQR